MDNNQDESLYSNYYFDSKLKELIYIKKGAIQNEYKIIFSDFNEEYQEPICIEEYFIF